jgi:DNA-binding PadR family transcriptional regulator
MGEELIKAMVRGLNRLIILWLLSKERMTGYGIMKELRRITGQPLSPGVVYPLLYELERGGYLTSEWEHRGSRRVRYYSTTERGREKLERISEMLETPLKEALKELLGEG